MPRSPFRLLPLQHTPKHRRCFDSKGVVAADFLTRTPCRAKRRRERNIVLSRSKTHTPHCSRNRHQTIPTKVSPRPTDKILNTLGLHPVSHRRLHIIHHHGICKIDIWTQFRDGLKVENRLDVLGLLVERYILLAGSRANVQGLRDAARTYNELFNLVDFDERLFEIGVRLENIDDKLEVLWADLEAEEREEQKSSKVIRMEVILFFGREILLRTVRKRNSQR